MKRHCSSSFDRISELPCSIRQTILMHLPLRDMGRTSVLSKNWRFQWAKVPNLVFEDYRVDNQTQMRRIFSGRNVVGILLLHHGPLLKVSLDMSKWVRFTWMDKIISFLSRQGIHELTLLMPAPCYPHCHKLPTSICFCVELRHLSISSCVLQPLTFQGFNKLLSLELLDARLDSNVYISSFPFLESLKLEIVSPITHFSIDAPNLKTLFFGSYRSNCIIGYMGTPLLKVLSLAGIYVCSNDKNPYDLIKHLRSLPLLESLHFTRYTQNMKALGDCPNDCLIALNNLRMLRLTDIDLSDSDDLTFTLWLLRSSPNLQIFKFNQYDDLEAEVEIDLFLANYTDYSLPKLRGVETNIDYNLCSITYDIAFLKFLLAVSPELETLYIDPKSRKPSERGYKILLELARSCRSSPKAKLEFVGLDLTEI